MTPEEERRRGGSAMPLPLGWRAKGVKLAAIKRARAELVKRRGEWLEADGLGDLGHQFKRVVDFIVAEAPRVARFLFEVRGPKWVRAWERNITGRQVGGWRIVERLPDKGQAQRPELRRRYLVECASGCGTTRTITAFALTVNTKHRHSVERIRCPRCVGKIRPQDFIGQRFGSFVVTGTEHQGKARRRVYVCTCDCGQVTRRTAGRVLAGMRCAKCLREAKGRNPHRVVCRSCTRLVFPRKSIDGECYACAGDGAKFGRYPDGKPMRSETDAREHRNALRAAKIAATKAVRAAARAENEARRKAAAPTVELQAIDTLGLGDLVSSLARLDAGGRGGLSSP